MRRALVIAVFALAACNVQRDVKLTFGDTGEGLDGFMCKDDMNAFLLQRLATTDGGVVVGSLVTDFVQLGGLPDGCRSGQLIKWCSTHNCAPSPTTRVCTEIALPGDVAMLTRAQLRPLLLEKFKSLKTKIVSENAPDGPVMLRVLATAQPCSEVRVPAGGVPPEYEKAKLVGCAYSCPTLFDKVEQDVFLGFDTLENQCEHGVRTCSDNSLKWAP